jgi:hypothetical protein
VIKCAQCDKAASGVDYLCRVCRWRADPEGRCDYCGYYLPPQRTGRFQGLCPDCVVIAEESVPILKDYYASQA